MAIVLDASVACTWLFQDEATPETDQIARDVANVGAFVPPLWQVEVTNVLLQALARQRITRDQVDAAVALLRRMNVQASPYTSDAARLVELGAQHRLTAYDALYLDNALALNANLATLDNDLRRAAEAEGVALLPVSVSKAPDNR